MKRLNQQGAVAMISVVIFSIILSVIVTAYASTIVSQQRESINYDLSTRAYYAAESGVQDVIRALKVDENIKKNGKNDCTPYVNGSGNADGKLGGSDSLAYTCQLVDVAPGELSGDTVKGSGLWPLKLESPNKLGTYKLTVTWKPIGDATGVFTPRPDDSKLFPSTDAWSTAGFPPVLRVSFIANSILGQPKRENLTQQVFFLNPTKVEGADSAPTIKPGDSGVDSGPASVQNSTCEITPDGYLCKKSFTFSGALLDGKELYAVMDSVYSKADYSISVEDVGSGQPVGFKDTAVSIDVTARAGNVFRRVKQLVNLNEGYQQGWFDAAGLVVGKGICKLYTVDGTPSHFKPDCNPLKPLLKN